MNTLSLKRIICEKDIINSIHILKSNLNQAVFNDINCIKIKKGGHILLDFGKELNGELFLQYNPYLVIMQR